MHYGQICMKTSKEVVWKQVRIRMYGNKQENELEDYILFIK